MSSSSLDSLASNGVINFDADAYIKGTQPRYVGNPEQSSLPLEGPMNTASHGVTPGDKLSGGPKRDAYVGSLGTEEHKKTSFPKILTGAIAAGLAIFGGIKVKSAFDKRHSNLDVLGIEPGEKIPLKNKLKGFWTNIKEGAITWFGTAKQKAELAAKKAKEEAERLAKERKGKMPKWLKVSGLVAGGALALYGLFNLIAHGIQLPNNKK